ncbi:hypothetical protein [Salinicoccus roseus]|uniref:hypothetical protein n=1 Tax=Salinicoccus roseus TaxID=45670 RepID=UPI0023019D50|nr:hypothetical protein [Salinicoccus roseus]
MEIIVVFISGLLIGVLIMQAVYRKDLEEMNDSFEEVRRRHNMMVNKMFDDIDKEVQDDLDRRFKRGKYAEDEDISFKYAVNPVPHLLGLNEPYGPKEYEELITAYSPEGQPIEEAKTYPPLKQIGGSRDGNGSGR